MASLRAAVLAGVSAAATGGAVYLATSLGTQQSAPYLHDAGPAIEAPRWRSCANAQDVDMDGVLDCIDRCAHTPVGTHIDDVGCPAPPAPPRPQAAPHRKAPSRRAR